MRFELDRFGRTGKFDMILETHNQVFAFQFWNEKELVDKLEKIQEAYGIRLLPIDREEDNKNGN